MSEPADQPDPRYNPHWRRWGDFPHDPAWTGRWSRQWQRKHRFFFFRFLGFLLLVLLLAVSGLIQLAMNVTRLVIHGEVADGVVWLVGVVVSLALPLVLVAAVAHAFRRYARPLANVMAAADAVAAGDLSVRVPEEGANELRKLAGSFNRMTGELARADEQRRNLTADVAHELRTPLHIIQGKLEGILDGVYPATPEQISATLDETRQLARLVDDLRTLSLAESGQLPLVRQPVAVTDLLADVATSFSSQAEAAGVDLRVAPPAATGPALPTLNADPGRLDQVLSNLVANALRHTPSGGSITLTAQSRADQRVQISVRDTGEGIPAADLPFIFDRFWRGDRARPHSGSTGLGLAIARQLVHAHGGTISASSEVGRGTVFTIELMG